MLSIYTMGPKWAPDWRWSQCPSSPSRSASQSRVCMINTSNNNNSPSSSTCQWAHAPTHTRARHGEPTLTHTHTHSGTHADTMCPNPCRAAHEHTDTAPSIMVNTSNSISFLDSWSLDRHGSDSPWFLAGCLPLQLPHFSLFPMKSAWAVTEHAAKIDSLTYYLFAFFVSLYNVMLESHLYNEMTPPRSFGGSRDATTISASPDQQTVSCGFSIFFWHRRVFLTTRVQRCCFSAISSWSFRWGTKKKKKQARPWNAFKFNLFQFNDAFLFTEGLDCKINDSPNKETRWSIGFWSKKKTKKNGHSFVYPQHTVLPNYRQRLSFFTA